MPVHPLYSSYRLEHIETRLNSPQKTKRGRKKKGNGMEVRTELIHSVQKKIEKGFYNSGAVLDDLSSSFAGVFNSRG